MTSISKASTIQPPQTLINQRAVKTGYAATQAAATIDMSGAALIADSLDSMSSYLSSSSSSDKVDLLGTASTDLFGFGVGSTLDMFV